jgi:transcription initiation factor TFIIH subunit 1
MADAIPTGKANYKKKDGIITLTPDETALIWTPLPGTGPPIVSLAVDSIKNIQQTPETAAKVILKIFKKPASPDETSSESYLFQFTSPKDARAEANAIRDVLSQLISGTRGNDPGVPRPAANGNGTSGPMAMANAAIPKPPAMIWSDDKSLKADLKLQRSLMEQNAELGQTYADARAIKPDSISDAVFNEQFWATRINLLRNHAIELNQIRGQYNVLSVVKPRMENDEFKLNIKPEQIQLIMKQYPLVRRIYDENVPKVSEGEFISKFFLSRLYKKLRGERVTENDENIPMFDKYIDNESWMGWTSNLSPQQIPHIIDVEANEENQGGFKSGNRQDVEMRPRRNVPVIKTLNSLSEKILNGVAPSDHDISGAATDTVDETVFRALALKDLQGDAAADVIKLNAKQQSEFFSNQDATQPSAEALEYGKQIPAEVVFEVQADLETLDEDGAGGIDLHKSIGVDDDSDSDGEATKPPHVGSRAARKAAQDQILEGMAKQRAAVYTANGHDDAAGIVKSPMSIPADITQRCYLTNATTTEFLKQFWDAFLSGDAARTQELAYYVESLKRSQVRIDALANEAEKVRQELVEHRKKEMKEIFRKTGRKTRWVNIGGGKEAVLALFEATITSLNSAQSLYKQALGH